MLPVPQRWPGGANGKPRPRGWALLDLRQTRGGYGELSPDCLHCSCHPGGERTRQFSEGAPCARHRRHIWLQPSASRAPAPRTRDPQSLSLVKSQAVPGVPGPYGSPPLSGTGGCRWLCLWDCREVTGDACLLGAESCVRGTARVPQAGGSATFPVCQDWAKAAA